MSRIVRITTAAVAAAGLAVTGVAAPAIASPSSGVAHHARPTATPKPSLKVTTNKQIYGYGARATFTAHLGKTRGDNRVVTLLANPIGGKPRVIKKGHVTKRGTLTARVRVFENEAFTARYDGDKLDRKSTVHERRYVRVHIKTVLKNSYKKRGKYHLFRESKNANYACAIAPNKAGHYAHFRLEVNSGSGWHKASGKTIRLNKNSVAGVTFNEPTGYKFRVHVSYSTDSTNYQLTTPWTYVRFT